MAGLQIDNVMSDKKSNAQAGGHLEQTHGRWRKKIPPTHLPVRKRRKDRSAKQWAQLMKDYLSND